MKNSSVKNTVILALISIGAIFPFGTNANAQAYYRVEAQQMAPAPQFGTNDNNVGFNMWGQEIAPYAYNYTSKLPNDGNSRWIDERCFQSSRGQTCIEGHWVKKSAKKCEEVSQHTIKTGNYTKIVAAGRVANCRQ
jgi:hypothetical protein